MGYDSDKFVFVQNSASVKGVPAIVYLRSSPLSSLVRMFTHLEETAASMQPDAKGLCIRSHLAVRD